MHTWYYIDADNNRKEPEGCMYCYRCKKKSETSYSPIIWHPDAPWFRIAGPTERPDAMIGEGCLRTVKKKYGEMDIKELK